MPLKYQMPCTYIKHRGFFNYSELLQAIRKWFIDDDFEVLNVPIYKQKFPAPTGVEHELGIHAEKTVTEYVKYHIDMMIRAMNMRDIEIIHEGKKMKMQEAQLQIEIIPFIEFDWQKRFQGPPPWKNFLKALDDFYRKHIIKYKIDDYWEDMVLLKAGQLARVIKETLGEEVI